MVETNTFLSATAKFIRDDLLSNITDPISASRPSNSRFVMTSYPERKVVYPLITIRHEGPVNIQRMGMRSLQQWTQIILEVRIWARNEKEKDELTEQTLNRLRSIQFGANSTSDTEELHDYLLLSATPVDEINEQGRVGVKSMVLRVQYLFVLGAA